MLRLRFALGVMLLTSTGALLSAEPLDVWPDLAPGETTRNAGETLPARPEDKPTITRVTNITRPTFTVHLAEHPNGSGAVILPGGGFGRVVPDLEGTEAAEWLNRHGVTAFVLSYRTKDDPAAAGWEEPLQDAQRTLALIRSQASRWDLKPDRIGLVAFSAGGQVGARLLCDGGQLAYTPIDDVDKVSHRPDFAVLIYPWNMYDAASGGLVDDLAVPKDCPPTYIVHTHDDRSSSLGAVHFYMGLKQHDIPAELHVYSNGGHGYGLRPRTGSQISTWPDHAAHFLATQGLATY
ncbi:MAG: alpha/beta hydrolase [Planctomycetaceae bacterium]|nr:alpha/beta hydrolase [Planctomycetaceae bacterium]